MTTATYYPTTGLGQDAWSQSIQQQYGQQPFGPTGTQGPGMSSVQPQAFQPQQTWQQPFGQQQGSQQLFGQQQGWQQQQPFGQQQGWQQILTVLPALIAQQAQQLYAIAQVCAQVAPVQAQQFGSPQFGLGQQGNRPYPIGY